MKLMSLEKSIKSRINKMHNSLITVLGMSLLFITITSCCYASVEVFPNNQEGTVKCTILDYIGGSSIDPDGFYVITKNIHEDGSCEYYWAVCMKKTKGFLGKELHITVDDQYKFTCRQYHAPDDYNKLLSTMLFHNTGIVYTIPAEVVGAMCKYKKKIIAEFEAGGEPVQKELHIKEDIKKMSRIVFSDLVK